MKAVTVKELKTELNNRSTQELIDLCLRLSRFKRENKELLTYLLFELHDEDNYIRSIKAEVDLQFEIINTNSYYYIRKSIRKILRTIKKFIRYSLKTETEVELLLYFCEKLQNFTPTIEGNTALTNLYDRQLIAIKKKVTTLHEDLQYDYQLELDELTRNP